jgi:hypothetical protein
MVTHPVVVVRKLAVVLEDLGTPELVKRVHSTKVVQLLLMVVDGVVPVAVVVGTVVVVVVDKVVITAPVVVVLVLRVVMVVQFYQAMNAVPRRLMKIQHKEVIVLIIVNTKTSRFYEVVVRLLKQTVLWKFHGVVINMNIFLTPNSLHI